jgi:hypothetical protein
MINRSETLQRLIKLRKLLASIPDSDQVLKEMDLLIRDLIGNLDLKQSQLIDNILSKAFADEITIETAMVAIHETVLSYSQYEQKKQYNRVRKRESKKELLAKGYK